VALNISLVSHTSWVLCFVAALTIDLTVLTFLSLPHFRFLFAPIIFTIGAAMSSRCSSPAPSDSSQSPVVQVFPADFIHAQKLSRRLDRLLGPDGYTCHWRLNQYFLDSWRPLNDVSGLALRLLLLPTRLLLLGLCSTDLPIKAEIAGLRM
jgi:hypothetical protein